ncbi:cupin domain-containing protein [Candidatus Venteria ishoeyi]|uniref:Cupin domain protein n=1 Tax=Candidatus Venteria ishoeyi TaxID=1899563 RepID=A0A1H6F909_9GAMM|nr:cupin domain-containing protein [Candidatus Venteria ishoeyi]SEH05504.1 Cupin domain protein [Candidatus Venteria ishoeyi]
MKYVKDKNWLEKEGYSKKIFLDENDLGTKGARVQEIKIKAGEVAKIHHHKIQTEIFYFLNKNGYFIVNGEKIKPKVGEILVVEPNDKHEIVNNTKEDFLYLCFKINYSEDDLYWDE